MVSCIGHCNCCSSGNSNKKSVEKKNYPPIHGADNALAAFENWCACILMGKKLDEAETKEISKAMIATNQQDYMCDEFIRIGKLLKG